MDSEEHFPCLADPTGKSVDTPCPSCGIRWGSHMFRGVKSEYASGGFIPKHDPFTTAMPCDRGPELMTGTHGACGWPWVLHFEAFRAAMFRIEPQPQTTGEQLQQVIPTYSLPPCPPIGTILSGVHKGSNPDQIPSVFVVVDDSILSKTNATYNVNWGQVLLEYGPLTVIGNVPGE